MDDETVLMTEEAAKLLRLAPATLDSWRSRGRGPVHVRLGRKIGYLKADLDAWLQSRRRRSTSDDPGNAA